MSELRELRCERLDESFFDAELPCGLRLRVVPRPGFQRRYAAVAVDFGSIDQEFVVPGQEVAEIPEAAPPAS